MRVEQTDLGAETPGTRHQLAVLHFGAEGLRPKAYIQAGLHADEAPGMLCAAHLREELGKLEADGRVNGHVVLVPAANPIGLAQTVLGTHHGRFALQDGTNFNRAFPDIADDAAARIEGKLGGDAGVNDAVVRRALRDALHARSPRNVADNMKLALLGHAIDADTVLDLHCDGEATVHLYTLTAQVAAFGPLAGWLGAEAHLHADVSGLHPFDEAVSRPWQALRRRFGGFPFPDGAIAATIELRGEADVTHAHGMADARAIINFLASRGHLAIDAGMPPPPPCRPTPLQGTEALEAPCAGLIVYRRETGDVVGVHDLIADIVDPVSGVVHAVRATTSGVFFARTAARFATAGRRIGKIAGETPFRSGNLLSP